MKILAIGDIHGRDNWKLGLEFYPDADKVIFIGDYTDSFTKTNVEILHNLKEIVEFKKDNPEKVELLIGNHDLSYMYRDFGFVCAGFRPEAFTDLNILFKENEELFSVFFKYNDYLFSHAGITNGWMSWAKNILMRYTHTDDSICELLECLNFLPKTKDKYILNSLGEKRGGMRYDKGSPLWADKKELINDPLNGFNQIVGHTYTSKIEKIDNLYFIDCLGKDNITKEDFLVLDI
jgi:hypothetical protein